MRHNLFTFAEKLICMNFNNLYLCMMRNCRAWAATGSDQQFYRAKGTVDGNKVIQQCDRVKKNSSRLLRLLQQSRY
jgi:hypothetical protein